MAGVDTIFSAFCAGPFDLLGLLSFLPVSLANNVLIVGAGAGAGATGGELLFLVVVVGTVEALLGTFVVVLGIDKSLAALFFRASQAALKALSVPPSVLIKIDFA